MLLLCRTKGIGGVVAVLQIMGVGGFYDQQRLVVATGQLLQVCGQCRQRSVPEGVVGEADNIEAHLAGDDLVKPPAEGLALPPFGQMQHDTRRDFFSSRGALYAPDTRLEQGGETIKFTAALAPAFAIWPEHAAVELITHLHQFGCHSGLDKLLHCLPGIALHLVGERRKAQCLPRLGLGLMFGVGPEVAVVQIQQ